MGNQKIRGLPRALSPFAAILDAARTRHGAAALDARLPTPKTPEQLKATPDDRYLSEMSLRIFRAGLRHSVVDAKWPAFEDVFDGFDPRRVDRKSTRLNSSHSSISYAVFCLK